MFVYILLWCSSILLPVPVCEQPSDKLGTKTRSERAALSRFFAIYVLYNHKLDSEASILQRPCNVIEQLQLLFEPRILALFNYIN